MPSWYRDLSALSTILEDDLWQVRYRSKEDVKKAGGSKETDDERRLRNSTIQFPLQISPEIRTLVGKARNMKLTSKPNLPPADGDFEP